jgi:acetyltransferase-like isoleucine patch superfamily enzyme
MSAATAPRAMYADWRRRRRLAADWRRTCFPGPPGDFRAFGEGSVIAPPARVDGPQWISIGRDVVIHEHVFLAMTHQPGAPPPLLEIGDRVRIGRFCLISVTGHTVIEDDVLISDEVHIGDTYHRYDVPGVGVQDQPLTEPGPIRIGRGALVNFGAIILRDVTVGEEAYVHAGAVVTRDVAPRTEVIGAPARVRA